jgi:hypothetical protein
MSTATPEEILKSLRMDANQKFFNHFDWVWLKKIKGGVSDCCLVADPCDWHAGVARVNSSEVGHA